MAKGRRFLGTMVQVGEDWELSVMSTHVCVIREILENTGTFQLQGSASDFEWL